MSGENVVILYAVLTHPARDVLCQQLIARLGGVDHVQVDVGGEGNWPNHHALLQRMVGIHPAHPYTHLCVLPDDVLPVDDFRMHLQNAVQANSQALIVLYHPPDTRNAVKKAYILGDHWCTCKFPYAVGLVWPVSFVRRFLEWIPGRDAPDNAKFWGQMSPRYSRARSCDDVRFYRWAEANKIARFATVPCLVEHLGNGCSLLEDEITGRQLETQSNAQVFQLHLPQRDWSRGL